MSKSMGEKIKQLRKAHKMTQTDLAGSEMTKSMLSQIENNTATPSMKNLMYIASRLNKPAAYFLEDSSPESSLPIGEIYEEYKSITQLLRNRKHQEALTKIEALLAKHQFDAESKIYADILVKYGDCLIDLNRPELGEEKIKEAVSIYKSKYLFVEAAKAYQTLIGIPWNEFDYEKCLSVLEQCLDIYSNSINRDYAFEIEALHIRAVLYSGLDRLEDCIATASEAISISKQTDIYYKADELYKFLAIMNGFLGNMENFDKQIEKARQFAVFVDNNNVMASIEAVCGIFQNQIGNPRKALEYIERSIQLSEVIAFFSYTEKAKALYALGDYQLALHSINQVTYPAYVPFKYDYLHLWSSKVYEGLILNKLGKPKEALQAVLSGIQKIEIVGASKTLAFAYKSLSEIYSDMGDFQNAFSTLKKSAEIEETAKENRLYY